MKNNNTVHLAMLLITIINFFIFITHSDAAVTLPETGQNLCYDAAGNVISCSGTGQDGDWLKGAAWPFSRFTDPGNGTVIDELTGVVWLKNAGCFDTVGGIPKGAGSLTWQNALTWSNALAAGSCGLNDGSTTGFWRLPNRTELESLADLSQYGPALPVGHPFINVQNNASGSYKYWTSSTNDLNNGSAWFGDMYTGYMDSDIKTSTNFVWPVRIALPSLTVTASTVNGTISPSSQSVISGDWPVPLTVTPDTGYYLDSNIPLGGTCPQGGFDGPYYFGPIYSNCNVIATFLPLPYTVYATAGANGSVTPTSQQVNYDSTGSISVTPNPGYQIATMAGCSGTLNGNTYTTGTITGDCTVTATFSVASYPITASAGANGSITPTGTTIVTYNGSQSYNITPATGYHNADVLVDGVSVGAVTSYTFSNVVTSHTITASFAIDTITITATAGTNGSITPSGATSVSYNGSQSYSITPATGYHIADVLVDGVSVGAVAGYTFSNVVTSHTITASFAINGYTITATAGTNGSITPTGVANVGYNGSQSYSIVPATGYHITDVLVDGVTVGAVAGYTFSSIAANHTIAASFAVNSYTITATAGTNGSITPTGVANVSYNGSQSYSITPATGYHIADVLVDGVTVGAVAGYTFSNVMASHTISASFAINGYTITATAGANGSITPVSTTNVTYNGSQSYSITPATGYHIADVLVDGLTVGAVTDYTFSNIIASHTISASFADITPPVITPAPEQIYNGATSNKIYRISGTVTDVSSVTVEITVDQIIYTPQVAPDGSYFQDVPLDAEKAYQITITATDAMGLKSQQFRTVVYSTVTIADALRAYKIAQGFIVPTNPDDFNLLDVAPLGTDGKPLGNGKIDLFDVLSLLSKSIGLGY
ncbi:MAG: DUF1566 domain-containing protein [Desulfuromonadaceae bacterium]|nr:DUF1566 domain-containing protein [Desulfuromonadaceae bacterium]